MVNSIKKYVILLIILLPLLLSGCLSQTYQGNVINVLDGDSINILHEGKELRIRLAEIDAPEHGQPFWKISKQALEDYVKGKMVEVEEFDVDQYGRVVGHVYLDDLWVNGALVREGYAYVYEDYVVSMKLYQYEGEAEKSKKGIWKLPEKERVKPWVWRKSH